MVERLGIVVTADDVNNKSRQKAAHAIGGFMPIGASVIVNFLRPGFDLGLAKELDLGIHLNITDGDARSFTGKSKKIFGPNKSYARRLYALEHHTLPLLKHVGLLASQPYFFLYIIEEFEKQYQLFLDTFKTEPQHLTYHNGLHFDPLAYAAYIKFARDKKLPHRVAPQYITFKPDAKMHPDVFVDQANTIELNKKKLLKLLTSLFDAKPEQQLMIAELCLHPTNKVRTPLTRYEYNQYFILTHTNLVRELTSMGIAFLPWAALKQPDKLRAGLLKG